jgi:outer membrane protein TolC
MQSKTYNILVVLLLSSSLYSNEILSEQRLDSLKLANEKVQEDSKKLKIDWINPITYTYSYSNPDNSTSTKQSTIAINQPIFKSGGIFSAVNYADNLKTSSELSIDMQKKALVTQALNIAFNIKKLNLQIKKQNLALDNAKIDLRVKKESVFNGLLDISFLNNAIISKNNIKASLLDLEYQKQAQLLAFNNLSSKKIDEIELPVLKQVNYDDFKQKHLEIDKSKVDIKVKNNLDWMTTAKYLPTINVNYSKNMNHTTDKDIDTYGFNVVVPLDFKGYYDTGASKVAYLQAKKDLEILKTQEKNFFHTKNLMLKTLDAKIALTKENIKSYKELLEQTIELANAGIKTEDDAKVLENSKNSELLSLEMYQIDKQIELLEIYGKLK